MNHRERQPWESRCDRRQRRSPFNSVVCVDANVRILWPSRTQTKNVREVRLWLSVIAYNLENLWRRLALPKKIGNWSLTSLQQRLVKTGRRLVKHARYYWLLLAEGHLTRERFGTMLRMIAALPLPNE